MTEITKPKTPDGRNIIDHYYYWNQEAIKADLDKKRLPFAILASNLFNDFNIATILRCCNAFVGKEFYYYGHKRFDRRGTVGMHHYEKLIHLPTEPDLDRITKDYVWVGMDNIDGAKPIDDFEWPDNALICLGQEQVGLPPEIIKRCQHLVYIRQFGAVRSLNAGCASAIAMYDYTTKYWKKHQAVPSQ